MVTIYWFDLVMGAAIISGISTCIGVIGVFWTAVWIDSRRRR